MLVDSIKLRIKKCFLKNIHLIEIQLFSYFRYHYKFSFGPLYKHYLCAAEVHRRLLDLATLNIFDFYILSSPIFVHICSYLLPESNCVKLILDCSLVILEQDLAFVVNMRSCAICKITDIESLENGIYRLNKYWLKLVLKLVPAVLPSQVQTKS